MDNMDKRSTSSSSTEDPATVLRHSKASSTSSEGHSSRGSSDEHLGVIRDSNDDEDIASVTDLIRRFSLLSKNQTETKVLRNPASLEDSRNDTEDSRDDTEDSRDDTEDSRDDTEDSRDDTEDSRDDTEDSRDDTGDSRDDTEDSRDDAEDSRDDTEDSRDDTEDRRDDTEDQDYELYANVPIGAHNIYPEDSDPVYGEVTWDSDSDDLWAESEWEESEDLTEQEEKAKHITQETLHTEEKYVKKLNLLNKFNMELETLLKAKKDVNLSDYLFPNIDSIYKLHHEHLLPALQTVGNEWTSTSSLASAFTSDIVPFFNLYFPYVTKLTSVSNRVRQLKQKYSDIKDKLEKLEKSPEFEMLQIEMIMLEPFQRLPRYKLLLQRYQKCLDENDKEQFRLTEILSEIEKVYSKVQSYLLEQDSFDQLHDIQDRIPGFMVVANGREFIREGEAVIACENLQKWKQCFLFLFSDLLLITSRWGSLGKHKVQSELSLDHVRLEHMPEDRAADRLLLIKRQQHVTCLLFKSKDDKDRWEEDLTRHIGKCRSSPTLECIVSSSTTSHLFASAPVWHPDSLSAVCMLCGNKFTTLTRRHHCRGCGIITCGKCSHHTARIPYKDYKRERICDVCFKQATDVDPSLLKKSNRHDDSATNTDTVPDAEKSGAQE